MNRGSYLRIPLLGSVDLSRWARRRPAASEATDLHWDPRHRRWVTHEDAHLSVAAAGGETPGRPVRRSHS
jgi:hypothetical protein